MRGGSGALNTRPPARLDDETSARLRALPATEVATLVGRGEIDPASLVRACLTELGVEFTVRAVLARALAPALDAPSAAWRGRSPAPRCS